MKIRQLWFTSVVALTVMIGPATVFADDVATATITPLWDGDMPPWDAPAGEERDASNAKSRKAAGRPVVRLTDVSTPQLYTYHPADGPSDTAVVICPGGGFSILAWDLEGTEIARYFARGGVSAAVVKYRVPTRNASVKFRAPVQDARRAVAMLRSGDGPGGFEPTKIGLLGFSAGGHTVAQSIFNPKSMTDGRDDTVSVDFGVLVYPAYLLKDDAKIKPPRLADGLTVTKDSPPMFFAHAVDDPYSAIGSMELMAELMRNDVRSELHVFASGGHGFGGRDNETTSDAWLDLCLNWMIDSGFVAAKQP